MSVKQVFNTSAELDYPTVLPTLDLDFANSKTLDPRITFTRASGGSYVGADGYIKFAGVNEARFDHNPSTGESLGLLVEEARTNLFLRSQDLLTSPNLSGATLGDFFTSTVDALPSPSGSTNETVKFVSTPTTSQGLFLRQGGLSLTAQTYTVSVYVYVPTQAGVTNWQMLWDYADSADSVQTTTQTTFDRWVRISAPTTLTSTRSFIDFKFRINNSGAPTTSGITLYAWGAQLEAGAFPTSYIPTEASTRTRAADNASITGKNFSEWYRPDEGTLFAQFKSELSITNNIWSINNYPATTFATTTNYFRLLTLSNIIHTQYYVGGTNLYPQFSLANNNSQKVTQSYNINSSPIISALNGTIGTGSGNIYATSPGFNQLEFGKNTDARTTIGQYTISRLTYYPKRLTNSQLQALTK